MLNLHSFLATSAVIAVISAVIYFMPSPIDPVPVELGGPLPDLVGPLEVNTHLQKIRKLFQGQLLGPESFAAGHDGSIYTGTGDGKIWRIKDDQLTLIGRTGIDHPDCGSYQLEPQCGRPKGLKMDAAGRLIVADSYMGILQLDVVTGQVQVLVDSFNGSRFRFLNGLDIGPDGTIYFTDSSTKWERRDYRYEVIETNRLGRVLALDPGSRAARLVQDGLYLANGVCVSLDGTYLLVAEMSISAITKIHLSGPRVGQREPLVTNLPGYPDNLKRNSRGFYYVGMGSVRFKGSSLIGSFLDLVAPYPPIKRLVTKIIPASFFDVFLPRHALMLEIDDQGHIVTSHHDPGGHVISALSEAFAHGDQVYIGHFKLSFVGVIKLSDLHGEH
ncbi:adipocyte plasma membrane-associated protein-like [Physella acuta]|uniref:adipocyte plasma membrane-associated protein-like n=1 Tax=Physella acuta TaxID=109671 RepID=UPI0027DAC08C|nr:adipocyte plasma membrane-associated protein-like [Physella acuta]